MPDEYIRRAEALEITTRTCGDYAAAFAEIRKLPAADVAEVVRCKDCKHLVNATINANGFLICEISDMEIAPEDFCSRGERREE